MGCLSKIGCLALVIILLIVGYLGRGLWMPKLRGSRAEPATATSAWQPLTPEGGARAQRVLQQLSSQSSEMSRAASVRASVRSVMPSWRWPCRSVRSP